LPVSADNSPAQPEPAPAPPGKKEVVFHGIPASPGIAIGSVQLFAPHSPSCLSPEERDIDQADAGSETERFNTAIERTRQEITELQKRVQGKIDEREAGIFDAHLLIVDDNMLLREVEDFIRDRRKSAETAFHTVIKRYISAISAMADPYIKERAADIEDVASRVISHLSGVKRPALDNLPGQRIIIATNISPSDVALLDRENVLAFAVESGSRTSHTAILARSMQIPAVLGLNNLYQRLSNDDLVIVDGFIGIVIINPKEETQNLYALKETREERYYAELLKESRLRPETTDGFCVQLAANIENAQDIEKARRYGAAGVGLFRTEYLFINSRTLPSEETQFQIYRTAAERMEGQPVVIRTIDLGGDKLADNITIHHESNPFLGLRAVRLCLEKRPDMLRSQMRAILRAGAYGDIKIMFPMITSVEELDRILSMLEETKADLAAKKEIFNKDIETGIMIEIPSAAILAGPLAKKVKFFSIGTNDLVQYTLAVDRGNDSVAYLYQPSHPAVLQLINQVVHAARAGRIWVSVCGEMAGDPRYTPLLVGLGIHELSMSSGSIGAIRRIVRRMSMFEAEEAAVKALSCQTAEEALNVSEALLYKVAPDIVSIALKGA
jgi:phosphotransferase system enzyme I (PtsI)